MINCRIIDGRVESDIFFHQVKIHTRPASIYHHILCHVYFWLVSSLMSLHHVNPDKNPSTCEQQHVMLYLLALTDILGGCFLCPKSTEYIAPFFCHKAVCLLSLVFRESLSFPKALCQVQRTALNMQHAASKNAVIKEEFNQRIPFDLGVRQEIKRPGHSCLLPNYTTSFCETKKRVDESRDLERETEKT